MARFYSEVGFANKVEIRPGVWEDRIIVRKYQGDLIKNSRKLDAGDRVHSDISVGNSISIVADPYAREHFFAMMFVKWAGALWTVTDVEVQSPRLILRLGGVYNGPTS